MLTCGAIDCMTVRGIDFVWRNDMFNMVESSVPPLSPLAGLTREGCLRRQAALRERLATLDVDVAVLSDARHIHYFTGHWDRGVFPSLLLIEARGRTTLAVLHPIDTSLAIDELVLFPGVRHGNLIDAPLTAAHASVRERLRAGRRFGYDVPLPPDLATTAACDLGDTLRALRRRKEADELALIRRGIAGCEAAYAAAREMLRPGVSEFEVYVECQRAATLSIGEPIGEFGNDFQSGTAGGPPRHRRVEAGELMPLDLSAVVRGYSSDLCRTFAIGDAPAPAQHDAHRAVTDALEHVERSVRPGLSCRALHEEIAQKLDGYRGWRFPHHLGHGIGLAAHEAPRLNPQWDDTFAEGDVFTAEPALYADELRGGVRIEQDYRVTADGVERLSSFATDL
jgi:Xaa-Pro dipeptidase